MKTILHPNRLILVPENDAEAAELAAWKADTAGHVFIEEANAGSGLPLRDLGPREIACREPLNIGSRVSEPELQIISNFAATPFVLDGEEYASVEGFWQGLKFTQRAERRRVAQLVGGAAKGAGDAQGYGATVEYGGETIPVGTWAHWQLMRRACEAKFTQDAAAQAGLLSTYPRPLTHRLRRDSRSIPGVIMAEIWTEIRENLVANR